jgi:hypothetical protein
MSEAAAYLGPTRNVALHAVEAALLFHDAAEHYAGAAKRRRVRLDERVPPETFA